MEITLRNMEIEDYESVYLLISNELGYTCLDMHSTYNRLEDIRKRDNYCTFVAINDNEIIGFIGLMKGIAFNIDGEYLQIIALAVKKEYQNKGVGTQLLDKAEQYACINNIHSIGVNSGLMRINAHSFYEHRGYSKKSFSFLKLITKNQ